MGVSVFGSSYKSSWNTPSGNPNPHNFYIYDHYELDDCVALKMRYPDCNNYEGNKIVVYCGWSLDVLKNMASLDPHFSADRSMPSPFARFEPTDRGWEYAKKLVNRLAGD